MAELVSREERQSTSYAVREKESDRLIQECSRQGNCNPRIVAMNKFISELKSSQFSDMTKVQLVNSYVNEMIKYLPDSDKDEAKLGDDWYQTTHATLTSGMGECADIAYLKRSILSKIGIDDSKMYLVGGIFFNADNQFIHGHEELLVNLDGHNYMLNSDVTSLGFRMNRGGIVLAATSVVDNVGHGKFIPITAKNNDGVFVYNSLEQYADGTAHMKSLINPTIPEQNNMPQLCGASSCVEVDSNLITSSTAGFIAGHLEEAHRLNPDRLQTNPAAPAQTNGRRSSPPHKTAVPQLPLPSEGVVTAPLTHQRSLIPHPAIPSARTTP